MLDLVTDRPAATGREARLQALLTLWPEEIDDTTVEGRLHVIRALRRELREERRRALEYAKDYSADRHARLLAACRMEEEALQKAMRREFESIAACGRYA